MNNNGEHVLNTQEHANIDKEEKKRGQGFIQKNKKRQAFISSFSKTLARNRQQTPKIASKVAGKLHFEYQTTPQ